MFVLLLEWESCMYWIQNLTTFLLHKRVISLAGLRHFTAWWLYLLSAVMLQPKWRQRSKWMNLSTYSFKTRMGLANIIWTPFLLLSLYNRQISSFLLWWILLLSIYLLFSVRSYAAVGKLSVSGLILLSILVIADCVRFFFPFIFKMFESFLFSVIWWW